MNMKIILLSFSLIAMLCLAGCFSSAQASTGQPQPVIDTQPCYDKAAAIVGSAWGELSRLQRAALAMQAINACEGGAK